MCNVFFCLIIEKLHIRWHSDFADNAAFCNMVLLPVNCSVHWLDLPGTFCVVQSAVLWTISFYAICWAWHGLPGTWLWEPTDGGSVSLGTTGTNLAFLKKPQVQNPTSSSTESNFLVESFSIISSLDINKWWLIWLWKKRIMWKFARFCLRPHCRAVGSLLCNSSRPLPVESRKLGLIMVRSTQVMSSRLTINVFSDTYIAKLDIGQQTWLPLVFSWTVQSLWMKRLLLAVSCQFRRLQNYGGGEGWMHRIACYCLALLGIAWYCMVL